MDKKKLIDKESQFDVAILAAGDFPKNNVVLEILKKTTPLVVCDSAMEEVIAYNKDKNDEEQLNPSAVVGDGDSLHSELKEKYRAIWHHYSEQDFNDLTKATKFAIKNYSSKTIAYFGATGKREDHTIGNISLMRYYHEHLGIAPTLITDYGWFVPSNGEDLFESFAGQQVSIFNCGCKRLESEGLKWNTSPFNELWEGTLNEATSDSFKINGDGEYLVFRTFKKKIMAK